MYWLQQLFLLVNQIGLLNRLLVSLEKIKSEFKIMSCFFLLALTDDDLYVCSEWIKPFFDVLYFGQNLMSMPVPASRPSSAVPIDEIYSIQIHNISLDFLVNEFYLNIFLKSLYKSFRTMFIKNVQNLFHQQAIIDLFKILLIDYLGYQHHQHL
jgi:hypothetical protein